MAGALHWIDWGVVVLFIAASLWIGMRYTARAGTSVEEFFLAGRKLPWWLTGTSMVATSFAADTPLVVTGWVRDDGIWKNWVWWAYATGGMLQVFLFARWWQRSRVMTKAEFVELRYRGREARILRGLYGFLHAVVTNTWTLCWVTLAAAKISEVIFGLDKVTGLVAACLIGVVYVIASGFWGVVMTDLFQFAFAMLGAILLAIVAWGAVEGIAGLETGLASGAIAANTLRMVPAAGTGSIFDASFWTAPLAAFAVYIGVAWWAIEHVDGSPVAVQRIVASSDERQGVLAMLCFNIAHYALRPWCWILVALASLLVLPGAEVRVPEAVAGQARVVETTPDSIVLELAAGSRLEVPLEGTASDFRPEPTVARGTEVRAGELLARTDSERAYLVMMRRYLPVGVLGLVAASLVAAFLSTVDTHINTAASFFVNDLYRRFWFRDKSERHYVLVARISSFAVLALAGLVAWQSSSMRELFVFFLAFLSGIGPVYVLRWIWWRVRACAEITALVSSALVSTAVTVIDAKTAFTWPLGALSPDGSLSDAGRILIVTLVSLAATLIAIALSRRPDPGSLVDFYRRVRPIGWWGPVRALAGSAPITGELGPALLGSAGALALTFGLLFGLGFLFLDRPLAFAISAFATLLGTFVTAWALRRLAPRSPHRLKSAARHFTQG